MRKCPRILSWPGAAARPERFCYNSASTIPAGCCKLVTKRDQTATGQGFAIDAGTCKYQASPVRVIEPIVIATVVRREFRVKLYTYFRSSAAWRVRIALALKGLPWEPAFVHLLKDGGQQKRPEYRLVNPTGLVPTLGTDQGEVLIQSLAIIEWLEETHPEPPLLPKDALQRARVRGFALTIACDIHPLNNLRVLRYLKDVLGQPEAARNSWYAHWIAEGLSSLEALLQGVPGPFCFGEMPGMADICLVPQMANARRMHCPLDAFPILRRAETAALALPAFRDTSPEHQPDAG
jgi:maleylpyruvate isomerase